MGFNSGFKGLKALHSFECRPG